MCALFFCKGGVLLGAGGDGEERREQHGTPGKLFYISPIGSVYLMTNDRADTEMRRRTQEGERRRSSAM